MKNPLPIWPETLPTNFLLRRSNSLDLCFLFYKIGKDKACNNQMRPMHIQAPYSSTQNSVLIIRLSLLENLLWFPVFILIPETLLVQFPCLINMKSSLITQAQRRAFLLLSSFMIPNTHLAPYLMPGITMLLLFQEKISYQLQ